MTNNNPRARKPGAPGILIREMELEDLPAVYELGERLFTSEKWPNLYRTWDEYELVSMFSSDSDTCLIAETDDDDEKLVGFILGTVIDKRKSAWSYGYVVWLGVDTEVGRRGVASRLMERLTQIFVELGVRILMCDTDAENEAAITFFQNQGFGNISNHVYMTKNLQSVARPKAAPAPPTKRKPKKKPAALAGKRTARRRKP